MSELYNDKIPCPNCGNWVYDDEESCYMCGYIFEIF